MQLMKALKEKMTSKLKFFDLVTGKLVAEVSVPNALFKTVYDTGTVSSENENLRMLVECKSQLRYLVSEKLYAELLRNSPETYNWAIVAEKAVKKFTDRETGITIEILE